MKTLEEIKHLKPIMIGYYKVMVYIKLTLIPFFSLDPVKNKEGARWLINEEVKLLFPAWNTGLIIDWKSKRLSEKDSFWNLMLVAKVWKWKTSWMAFTNLIDLSRRHCSISVHDPKWELHWATSWYFQSKGFRVIKYSVIDPKNSYHHNPFQSCHSETEIDMVCEMLLKFVHSNSDDDSIWDSGAFNIISVLAKCLSYGDPEKFNLPELYEKLKKFGYMGDGLHDWVYDHSLNPATWDRTLWSEWVRAVTLWNSEWIMSFILTASAAFKPFSSNDMKIFYGSNDYDLAEFRKEKTVIFFITPPTMAEHYSFTTSLFFRSLFNECMADKYLQNPKNLPVYIVYDEFWNSFIPDFSSIATTARGYDISLTLIVQTIEQLDDKYGKAKAWVIHSAINTYMILNSADTISWKYFSELAGTVIESQRKGIVDRRTDRREYSLINHDGIRRLKNNTALLISTNHQPTIIKIRPHYKNKLFKAISSLKPVNAVEKPHLKIKTHGKISYLVDTRKAVAELDRATALAGMSVKQNQNAKGIN